MKIWPGMTRAPFQQSLLFKLLKAVRSRLKATYYHTAVLHLLFCLCVRSLHPAACNFQQQWGWRRIWPACSHGNDPITPPMAGPLSSAAAPGDDSLSNSRDLHVWNKELFWNLCATTELTMFYMWSWECYYQFSSSRSKCWVLHF